MPNRRIKIFTQINIVGFILVIMAGWINVVGLKLFLKENSSFMSGRGAILGVWAFQKNPAALMKVIIIVISFILGSYISTLITKKMGLAGGLCFTGVSIIITAFMANRSSIPFAIITLPMAMGGQNAATSLTPINRTTHLTGPATDIGINLAKGNWSTAIFWILRWVGFPIGSFIGFYLVRMAKNAFISPTIALTIPGIVIIGIAIVQKIILHIPLLDRAN